MDPAPPAAIRLSMPADVRCCRIARLLVTAVAPTTGADAGEVAALRLAVTDLVELLLRAEHPAPREQDRDGPERVRLAVSVQGNEVTVGGTVDGDLPPGTDGGRLAVLCDAHRLTTGSCHTDVSMTFCLRTTG